MLINDRPGAEAEAVRKEHKWRHTCIFRLRPTHHNKCLLSACYVQALCSVPRMDAGEHISQR